MSAFPSTEGRGLHVFRLSDVPLDIRMKAAQKCADLAARDAEDPLEAIFETLKLERVAADPVEAARTMPDDCQNAPRVIERREWEKATSPRRRW